MTRTIRAPMEIRCSRKRCAGSVAGCFLDGSRVASGWAGGVAGGQKWVVRVGWKLAACGWWEWGEGTQYHPPRPFNPAVLGGAVEPVPSPPFLPPSSSSLALSLPLSLFLSLALCFSLSLSLFLLAPHISRAQAEKRLGRG